jgi:hypothetical protein
MADFEQEQSNYLAHPLAFWNRPDGAYLSDEPYVPLHKVVDFDRQVMVRRQAKGGKYNEVSYFTRWVPR